MGITIPRPPPMGGEVIMSEKSHILYLWQLTQIDFLLIDKCQHLDDSHPKSELGQKLVEVKNTLNLHQMIDEPTRYLEYSASIVDLLMAYSHGLCPM